MRRVLKAAMTWRSSRERLPVWVDSMPRLLQSVRSTGGDHVVVALFARFRPGSEVVCATADYFGVEAQLEQVLAMIPPGELAPGCGSVTHRPGMIQLANGSRIRFRVAHDERAIKGLQADLVWWMADDPCPEDLARLVADTVPAMS